MRSPWSSSGPVAFFVSLNSYRHHRQHRIAHALFFYDRSIAVPTTTTTTTTTLALIDNRRVTTTTTTDCLPHDDVIIARYELDDQFSRWRFLQQLLEGDVIPPNDVEDILLLALSAYLRYGPTSNHSSGGSSSSSSSSSMLDEKKDKDEDNGGNASPVLTPSQRIVMTDIIESIQSFASSSKDDGSDGIKNDRRFLSMLLAAPNNVENVSAAFDCGNDETMVEVDESALTLLERIEKNLLPDPIDDEDAYMGTWDVIIDLHGRESVRVSEDRLSKERDDDDDDEEGLRLIRHATSRVVRRKNLQWRTLSSIGRVLIHFDLLTKGVLKEGSFASSSSLSNDK